MKAARILQALALVALLTYFVLLHAANPTMLILPFFLPAPPALVLAVALLLGWLIGWIPGRVVSWRKSRELSRLERRVAELEQHVPSYDKEPFRGAPVIPDRMPEDRVLRDEDVMHDRRGG